MISSTDLEVYLNRYGWSFQKESEDIFITGFVSESSEENFLLSIQLLPPWLRFSIPFYLPPPTEENWGNLARLLLQLNYNSRQVYFGISDDEGISLITDVYVESGLDYEAFEMAIDLITYVAESSFLPLMSSLNSTNTLIIRET